MCRNIVKTLDSPCSARSRMVVPARGEYRALLKSSQREKNWAMHMPTSWAGASERKVYDALCCTVEKQCEVWCT